MFFISLAIFLVFAVIWFLPIWKKYASGEGFTVKNFFAFFARGLLAFLVAFVFQVLLWQVLSLFGMSKDTLPYDLINHSVLYAVLEEFVKLFFAILVCRKLKVSTVKSYVLIFGAVGLGFGTLESLMVIGQGIVEAIIRGVFSLHIFFQLWMGYYYSKAQEQKTSDNNKGYRKNMIIAVIIPIIIHLIHDDSAVIQNYAPNFEGSEYSVGTICMLVSAVIDITFIVITLRKAHRLNKEQ